MPFESFVAEDSKENVSLLFSRAIAKAIGMKFPDIRLYGHRRGAYNTGGIVPEQVDNLQADIDNPQIDTSTTLLAENVAPEAPINVSYKIDRALPNSFGWMAQVLWKFRTEDFLRAMQQLEADLNGFGLNATGFANDPAIQAEMKAALDQFGVSKLPGV